MNELLVKVRSVVRLVQRTFGIMEAVLSVFYGALLGTVFSNYDKGWWWIIAGVTASTIYLPLLIVKVRSQWILPDQIFEHLDAKIELNSIKQELARKEAIDGFIDQAIKTLNSATCKISNDDDDTLCESAMSNGISEVLGPLIHRTQIVLDCNTAKFAVGVLVTHHQKSDHEPKQITEWLVLRDDVGIAQEVTKNPLFVHSSTGSTLQIRQALEIVLNENRMVERPLVIKAQSFQMVCSPIPLVCNEELSNGVLWIVQECTQPAPQDLANILLIFGRIVANWISKYDECLWNRYYNGEYENQESEDSPPTETPAAEASTQPQNQPTAP